jgi:putative endonuclease
MHVAITTRQCGVELVAMGPRVKPEDDGEWGSLCGKERQLVVFVGMAVLAQPSGKTAPAFAEAPRRFASCPSCPPLSVILGLDPSIHAQHSARMAGYVYIVTNQKNGTLYIGVTSDLERRIYEHREGLTPGFAWKYGCTRLVWYEEHWDIGNAIQREKSLKRWYRQWKVDLVEAMNPGWDDLYLTLW